MKKIIPLITVLCILMMSCNSGNSGVAEVPSNFDADYLFANAKQLEKLVDLQDIAQLTDIKPDDISAYQENFDDNAATQFLLFSWENGENIEAGDQKIAARSSIGFGRLEKIAATDFILKYQQKTAEAVKKEIETITKDESIDPDVAIWNAKELVKQAKTQSFEKLENVGDAAYWESPTNVLHVLVKDLAFTVSANYGNDEAKNKEKAIELAQLIFKIDRTKAN